MDKESISLPFLTSEQLKWGIGRHFELQLSIWANVTDDILIIGATRSGPFTFRYTPQALGTEETATFEIADIPIFVTIRAAATTSSRGQLYCVLYLAEAGTRLWKLVSGYPSYGTAISWPQTPGETELLGRNKWQRDISNNPAAGSEISFTPFAAFVYIIKAIHVQLVTDANAATRQLHLKIPVANASQKLDIPAATSQIASLTRDYYFIPGATASAAAVDGVIITPLPPDLMMYGSQTLVTSLTNKQAGDDYGSMSIYYEPLYNI